MSNYDEMIASGNRQLEKLDAAMAQANAEYHSAKVNDDPDTQDAALQTLCDLDQQRANLWNAYNRQLAAAYAAAPRQPSREELNAMPLEHMTEQQRKEYFRRTSKNGISDAHYDACLVHLNQERARR
jgi:hypothetical protein